MRNKKYLKKINEQLILRTAIYITVYMLMGILIRFLAVWIYNMRTWMGTETLYRIVHWLDIRSGMVAALYFAVGAVTILIYYWRKTLSYLQEVVDATDKVYKRDNALIELSEPLKEVENSMNQTKLDIINSENMAREAEQRKNDLVTYLAHDLKTPITSVIGYLTLLKDEPDISPDMRAKYVGIALNKAERLEYLINEFFDITRFNLSKLVLEPERLNLSRMLEQIVSEFYPVLAEKGLKWKLDIEPNVDVLCDPDKLERVFDNLIRNAVNYSYADTEIYLSMKRSDDDVEIRVNNHGKTISPEKLQHVFEQFFRLDSSRSSYTGGSGLGLAISKEIIELHGGSIEAESMNESITFTVHIPVNCKKIV